MDNFHQEIVTFSTADVVTSSYDVTLSSKSLHDVGRSDQNFIEQNTSFYDDGYTHTGREDNMTSQITQKVIRSYYKEEQVGFLIFLFVGIVLSNGVVLVATTMSKRGHKSRMTFFIMHLAIADLMVGFVSVLTDLLWKVTVYWYAGNTMCHVIRYLQGVAMFASTYVLVALSIDRLEAIARPMSFHSSHRRARVLISTAWALSGLMALPLMILFREEGDPGHKQCGMRLPSLYHWKLYVTLLATCLFLVPTFIISLCYCVIIYVIWSKAKTSASLNVADRGVRLVRRFSHRPSQHRITNMESRLSRSGSKTNMDCNQSSGGVIPQAKIRTIKLTLIIVVVFVVCWSPYFIFNLLDVFGHIPSSPNKRAISILIGSLAPLNSLANPIIYGIFTTMICKNIRQVACLRSFFSRCCCPDAGRRLDAIGSFYLSTRQSYVLSSTGTEVCPRPQQHRRHSPTWNAGPAATCNSSVDNRNTEAM